MQRTSTRYEGTYEFSVVATVDIAPVDESLGLSGGLALICVVSVVATIVAAPVEESLERSGGL